MGSAAGKFCEEQGCTPMPTAPEAHNQNARVENRIGFYRALFTRVSKDCQLRETDDPWTWSSKIAAATNQHLRYGGFSPNQSVFGRDPRVPQLLLTDEGSFQAQAAANSPGGVARRAEQIRRSANIGMQEIDDLNTLARTMSIRRTPDRATAFEKGDYCYYWRDQGVTTKSKTTRRSSCWKGPCVVLAKEGSSKIILGSWNTIILVSPEQLRRASADEVSAAENMTDMLKAIGQDLANPQQMGYIDERGPPPEGNLEGGLKALERRDAAEEPAVELPRVPVALQRHNAGAGDLG